MVSSINSNIAAYSAQANIGKASANASSSIARLSSGNRIVKASDDVSGLAVGTSLATQVTSLKAALNNASQGTSLLQVADGALGQINDILQRQKAIASQAGSGSLTDTDRGFLDQEFQALSSQIDQIASATSFNGVSLLNGGLGTTTRLATSNTAAAKYTVNNTTDITASNSISTNAVSNYPIQAFDNTGASKIANFTTGVLGTVSVTDTTGGAALTAGYDSVNSALIGKFDSFEYTNVVYGATTAGSATLNVSINGVTFSGNVQGSANQAILHNGSTYINIGLGSTAQTTFTDAATTELSSTNISNGFKNTSIENTQTVQGITFDGTRLAGAVGSAKYGVATTRLSSTNANIGNFRYVSNSNAADSSVLAVDINGQTFTATGVKDIINGGSQSTIAFFSQDGQSLVVDLTGLAANGVPFTNIRTSASDQAGLINGLNQGFSRAGTGLNFSVGATASDTVGVTLGSVSSSSLYNGQSLSVGSAAGAAAASATLDNALNAVSTVRSTVGALESRFNFISANLQTSIQNQDAARGNLLDTDVSAESTSYATSQVQLQAGIAVLAQANQLPQNLLKLIQ